MIEAALPVFSTHGYEAVSIQMLCEAAGVSVGSLYHHFDHKAGVAAAVYAEAIDRYHRPLLDVATRGPDAEDGVRSLVEAHHRWVAEHTDWARFMVSAGGLGEIRVEAGAHEAANARLVDALMGWARPLMDSGALTPLEPSTFLSVMFGPSYFHTRTSLNRSPAGPDPVVSAQLAEAAWRSLHGPDPRPPT